MVAHLMGSTDNVQNEYILVSSYSMPPQQATGRSANTQSEKTKGKTAMAYVVGKWSAPQLDLLTSYVEAYKTSGKIHGQAKKAEWKAVLTNVFQDLKPLHPKLSKENWELVKLVRSISLL
jgi:hypothetical protein